VCVCVSGYDMNNESWEQRQEGVRNSKKGGEMVEG
jgi:hypothetical protein